MNILDKLHGKKIINVLKFNDSKGEFWHLKFILDDNSEFNVYMCENVDRYLDYDYMNSDGNYN